MSVALKKNREPRATDKAIDRPCRRKRHPHPEGNAALRAGRNISFSTRSLESYFFAALGRGRLRRPARRGGGGIRGQGTKATGALLAEGVSSFGAGP